MTDTQFTTIVNLLVAILAIPFGVMLGIWLALRAHNKELKKRLEDHND